MSWLSTLFRRYSSAVAEVNGALVMELMVMTCSAYTLSRKVAKLDRMQRYRISTLEEYQLAGTVMDVDEVSVTLSEPLTCCDEEQVAEVAMNTTAFTRLLPVCPNVHWMALACGLMMCSSFVVVNEVLVIPSMLLR